MRNALLAVRFVWEIALLVAWAIFAGRLVDASVLSLVLAGVVALGLAILWGAVLSPRRRINLPLSVRTLIELALFVGAALGLVVTGSVVAGVVLAVGEVVTVAWLWALGLPPGADAATES